MTPTPSWSVVFEAVRANWASLSPFAQLLWFAGGIATLSAWVVISLKGYRRVQAEHAALIREKKERLEALPPKLKSGPPRKRGRPRRTPPIDTQNQPNKITK
jgi:hypothetical protein